VTWLRRLDRGRGRVRLVDIADPDFRANSAGRDLDTLMARIHARLPDGTWLEGVEALRQVYEALGLGWLVAPTRLPGVRQLLDIAYARFARWRYRRRCAQGACGIGAGLTNAGRG
jgi:predicted DCC family thiol-disulfide oxidoreductase YuxK